MTDKIIVVSAANADYFPYLREMILSFRECGGHKICSLAVIDLGLDNAQLEWLKQQVNLIVRLDWPIEGLHDQPEWFKAMVCRPFFPRYFDKWDIIVWIDADSWFQDLRAIDLAIQGVRHSGFAVVPGVDRAYWKPSAANNAMVFLKWQWESLAQGFGREIADTYYHYPLISAGFFAGYRDAPHWSVWQSLLTSALKNRVYFSAEQAALCLVVHRQQLPTHFLPSYCHWLGHSGAIGIDTRCGMLSEPCVPFEPISIVALAAETKLKPVICATRDGREVLRSLRFGKTSDRQALPIGPNSANLTCDGIASHRFRESIFKRISRAERVRFLQIGAMDGISFDPIYPFVKQYGWHGVLVEPLPDMMQRLKANYADMQGIRFAQFAISTSSGAGKMFRIGADNSAFPTWTQGISSMNPSRNALGGKGISPELHSQLKAATIEVGVDTLSFADLVSTFDLNHIDVIQIDAEGCDWEILEQIDVSFYRPKTIQIEVQCLPPDEVALALNKLKAAGYVCYMTEGGEDLLSVREDIDTRYAC